MPEPYDMEATIRDVAAVMNRTPEEAERMLQALRDFSEHGSRGIDYRTLAEGHYDPEDTDA